MARADFANQLREMGHGVNEEGDRVSFPWKIPVGRFLGHEVNLGFQVPDDYALTPPGGPHVSPRLLPIKAGGEHPTGGVHESPVFGPEWEYLSRPFPGWHTSPRNARAYMAHIRNLFATM